MATITNAQVEAQLGYYINWFGPHDTISGVTDGVTTDAEDFTFQTVGNVTVTINYTELSVLTTGKQIILAALVDALAAAVGAAYYGPLTRTTAIASLPTVHWDEKRIAFTDKYNNTVYLTYTQLANAVARNSVVYDANAVDVVSNAIVTELAALKVLTDAMVRPYTLANYNTISRALVDIDQIKAHL